MTRTHSASPRGVSRPVLALALACCLVAAARAQQPPPTAQAAAPVVTAAATAAGVRFAALGPVQQTRLEVYDATGAPVFDTGFRAGNVRDFSARGTRGEPLPDGVYQCVISARDAAGRLSVKQAAVLVADGRATLSLGEAESAGGAAPGAPAEEPGAAVVATHDGRDGAVTSTAGDLTLRTGDVLAGKDAERVRVTADGRVGVGTDHPEATLDVAGAVRAQGGFRFSDGTTLNSTGGKLTVTNASGGELPAPSAAGTGTQNRLAKWAETGGAGTLTDSLLSETGATVRHNGNFFQMTGTPSNLVESNIIHLDTSNKTMGQVAGPGSFFGSGNGPYFIMRGNTYSAIPGQRGLAIFSGGQVASPVGREGSVQFNTLDQIRMLITPAGDVGIGLGLNGLPLAKLDVNGGARFTPAGDSRVIQFGTPNAELGMSLTNASNRADVRFDGTSLRLLAGVTGGPPPATNGISVNTAGNVGIGTSNPPLAKLHVLTATGGVPGIYSESPNRGVWGVSTSGSYGVYGESVAGIGVQGVSTSNIGVGGISSSNFGVAGTSSSSYGVIGSSTSNTGVRGETASSSTASPGVRGVSTGAGGVGVRGDGTTGVYGVSASGVGVTGESTSGFAVYANGNAGQAPDKAGFVKAMLYVDPFLPADQYIVRCYNGLNNTSTGNCGFTVTRDFAGIYRIEFGDGFQVSDRFFSLTMGQLNGSEPTTGNVRIPFVSTAIVSTFETNTALFVDARFYLIVY